MIVRLALSIAVVLLLLSCSAPGKPYSFEDVRIGGTPTRTLAYPTTSQGFTITVPVRSSRASARTVDYEFRENTDPADPLSGAVIATGSVVVPAFSAPVNVSLVRPAQTAGTKTYSLILDPADLLNEVYEDNNISTITVPVGDYDIDFSGSTAVQTPFPSSGDLTITLSIANTTNPAATPQASSVAIGITIDGSVTTVVPTSINGGAPAAVAVAADSTVPVTITVPRPAPGTHTYTITLTPTPADGPDADNEIMIITPTVN